MGLEIPRLPTFGERDIASLVGAYRRQDKLSFQIRIVDSPEFVVRLSLKGARDRKVDGRADQHFERLVAERDRRDRFRRARGQ